MKTILLVILSFSVIAGAQDYFGDNGGMVNSEMKYEVDNAGKILLDNLNSTPSPYFDPQTDTCYVNNCPQVHCSSCSNKRRDCRTINCEGKKVEKWRESCTNS